VLIADEVGLGKAISAGLILRQAILSGLAKRVLILTPKSVQIQWQNELYEKFNLNVPIYDGSALVWRPCMAGEVLPRRPSPATSGKPSRLCCVQLPDAAGRPAAGTAR
jgi:hypothetical protein